MVSMIFHSWVDSVPVGWWIGLVIVGCLVAFYFLSPILLPIWALMPKWLRWVLGGFVITILAYAGGRYKGAKNEKDLAKVRDERAEVKRDEVHERVKNYDEDRVDRELRKLNSLRDE